MLGRDGAEQVGLGPERAKEIHRLEPQRIAALVDDRRVVARLRGSLRARIQSVERPLQDGGPELGRASATPHIGVGFSALR